MHSVVQWSVGMCLTVAMSVTATTWFLRPASSGSVAYADRSPSEIEDGRQMLKATSRVFEAISREVGPAVVYVEVGDAPSIDGAVLSEDDLLDSGSGVLVRPAGVRQPVVLTNLHVVGDKSPSAIVVTLHDGRLLQPTNVFRDEDTDLAVLTLDEPDLPFARLGNSDEVAVGDWVLVIGSPFGLMKSVTQGIISALNRRHIELPRDIRIKEFLQTDAAINPGNSGGPLVDLNGHVIGINTAIASKTGSSSGVGFSIPSNIAKRVVVELVRYKRVRRAFLGIRFETSYDVRLASSKGPPGGRGAMVAQVIDGTPADQAGVLADDIILSFDGFKVEDDEHLINLIGQAEIDRTVEVIVWRAQKRVRLMTKLVDREKIAR